jgi:GntR family transcriptional regulator
MLQNSPRRTHDLLRAGIRNNLISRDEQLSDYVLTKGYQASRNAVREALQTLALEGLVTRIPRFGTKVTGNITILPINDLGPDVVIHSSPDGPARTELEEINLEVVPATSILQARLDLEEDSVLLVEHVLRVDDIPLYVRLAYLPTGPSLEALIDSVRAAFGSATPDSEEPKLFDIGVIKVETTVEAVPCDTRTARLLGITSGSPVLLRERMVYGPGGRPLELSFTHLRGDRTALKLSTEE